MSMTTKSVSYFAIIFILFLVVFEVPKTEAQDRRCLKEYGGDVGFSFCAPRIYPSFCYRRCRQNKGAKGGKCRSEAGTGSMKCLCDFCSDTP
ncbi:defensin-like protein 193 [Raphanus sativus]|uniref:Defensin-like protein 193 n=1 Tax=Raphanus sativus TaxID=3726 RepID=A0A6J0MS55_RAPSA|nr:defensin-like protein 193 [Raphanus sativus]XP_056861167.1 defensin-like protein 193 [Raphanus sativus]